MVVASAAIVLLIVVLFVEVGFFSEWAHESISAVESQLSAIVVCEVIHVARFENYLWLASLLNICEWNLLNENALACNQGLINSSNIYFSYIKL